MIDNLLNDLKKFTITVEKNKFLITQGKIVFNFTDKGLTICTQ